MDLLFSSDGWVIIQKMVVTAPATLSNFVNKTLNGIVEPCGFIIFEGESGATQTPLVLIHGRNGNVVDYDPLVNNLRQRGCRQDDLRDHHWPKCLHAGCRGGAKSASYSADTRTC